MDIYASSNCGRGQNLGQILHDYFNQYNFTNFKDVLIKVNMVDPSCQQACTDRETVYKILQSVSGKNPKKVLLGDEPAGEFQKKMGSNKLKDFYKKLYGDIEYGNFEFVDLRDFPETKIDKNMAVRDVKDYTLINVALPKAHGWFNYTGACKNLIGLVPYKYRNNFHHWVEESDNKSLTNLVSYFESVGKPDINILDGQDFLTYHEHFGKPVKTDFAIIGNNPVAVDIGAAKKLGFELNKIPYLQELGKGKEINICGNLGRLGVYPLGFERGVKMIDETHGWYVIEG